jgi:hypothetical protein
MNCISKILIKGDFFFVAKCKEKSKICLQYNNILIKFTKDYFLSFCSVLENVEFGESAIETPKGGREIVLNTGCHDIQFTFSYYEFEELKDLLQQTKIILDAEKVLQNSENKK